MLDLGDRVQDRLTGFQGIVISRTAWINGCARLGVQPRGLHEGKPLDSVVFDENQLELLEEKIYPSDQRVEYVARTLGMVDGKGKDAPLRREHGGPRDDINRNKDITR